MAFLIKQNNAETTITDNPLTAGATTINVTDGSQFPSTGDFLLTIWDKASFTDPGDDSGMEIVRATARTGNAITVTRAQESTTGVEHTNGETIAMLITALTFDDALDQNLKTSDSPTFVIVTLTSAVISPEWRFANTTGVHMITSTAIGRDVLTIEAKSGTNTDLRVFLKPKGTGITEILSSSGAISFGNENLITTGNITTTKRNVIKYALMRT